MSQTKRAIEGRRWRISAREKRKLNTVVSKYVEENHNDIYEKCKMFYDNVVDKYSTVQNLTKTEEFRFFLMGSTSNTHQQMDEAPEETGQEQTVAVEDNTLTREATEETASVEDNTLTREATEETASVEDNTVTREAAEETAAVEDNTITREAVEETAAVEDITLTPGNTYIENDVIINEYIVNNNNNTCILSEAAHEIDIDEGINQIDDMEAVVNGIIRELEAVEPSFFDLFDEGIDLNVEDEFSNLMEQYQPW